MSWAILFDATNCAQNYFAAAKIDLVNIEYVLRAHGFQQLTEEPGDRKFVRRIRLIGSPHRLWPRVPAVYLTWVNPVFLAFFAFNGTSNLRAFNALSSSIPTPLSKVLLSLLPLPDKHGLWPKRPWFWPQVSLKFCTGLSRGKLVVLIKTRMRMLRAEHEWSQSKLAAHVPAKPGYVHQRMS